MSKSKKKLQLPDVLGKRLKNSRAKSKLKLPANPLRRRKAADVKLVEAIQNLPRITNETVAEHREEVLSSARKYIYPLSHSKRKVVGVTVGLLITFVVVFFAYCTLALYKFQSTSTFTYGVTQVIPFPVAKAGSSWVSYESYLFELRHTMHYYQNKAQTKEDFSQAKWKPHLQQLKQAAMQQVIDDAYVKQLARKNHVSVSNQEVDAEVTLVREQNRLGSNDQVFRDVLSEFWGWSVTDFKRELKQQLLAQKVVAALDTSTQARAQSALDSLKAGADFANLARQVSDDGATKVNGGEYGFLIDASNRDIAPQAVAELFKLQPGQISGIINTGYALEIDKVIDIQGAKVHAAHIVFNLKDISSYTKPLETKKHEYISVK